VFFEIRPCPARARVRGPPNTSLLIKRPRMRVRPSNYGWLVLRLRACARGTAFRKTQPLGVPWGGPAGTGCWHARCDTLRYARSGIPCSKHGGVAQLVRALPCHGRGRGFESRRSRHLPRRFAALLLEERQERGLGLDCHHAVLVEVCGFAAGLEVEVLLGELHPGEWATASASDPALRKRAAPRSYNASMSAARPTSTPKASPPPPEREDLVRGLPGTDSERAEQRRRFAEEHGETLRRLGK
jgi:hypothetical protein